MAVTMEMILSHNGLDWIGAADGIEVRGRSLEELDRRLRHELIQRGELHEMPVRVCMRFDMDSLPRRLRQYSGHYFNRSVSFSL